MNGVQVHIRRLIATLWKWKWGELLSKSHFNYEGLLQLLHQQVDRVVLLVPDSK